MVDNLEQRRIVIYFFLQKVVEDILKKIRWARTRMTSVDNAHKSFESVILCKLVILNRFLTTLANEVFESRLTRGEAERWFSGVGAELQTLLLISNCCYRTIFTLGHWLDIVLWSPEQFMLFFCDWLAVSLIVIWWWAFRANFIVARLDTVNRQVVIICVAPKTELFHVQRRSLVVMKWYHSR